MSALKLHTLINSLNRSDKIHIRLALDAESRQGKQKYEDLYDFLLNDLPVFDNDAIKAFINKHEGFKKSDHHAAIRQLSGIVFKVLRTQWENNPSKVATKVRCYFENGLILRERQFHSMAIEEFDKGIKLAAKHELTTLHHEGVFARLRIKMETNEKKVAKELEKDLALLESLTQKLHAERKLNTLYYDTTNPQLFQKANAQNRQALFQQALEVCKEMAIEDFDFDGQVRYCFLRHRLHFYLGERADAVEWIEKALDLFAQRKPLQKTYLEAYIKAQDMYLNLAYTYRKWEWFPQVLRKAEALQTSPIITPWAETQLFQLLLLWKFNFWLNTGQFRDVPFSEIVTLTDRTEQIGHNFDINRLLTIQYMAGVVYFFLGDYDKAQYWWDELPKSKVYERREEVKRATSILLLFVEYELSPDDVNFLHDRVEATRQRLRDWGGIHEHENTILLGLRRLLNAFEAEEQTAIIKELFEELVAMRDQEKEKAPTDEVIFWLGTKSPSLDTSFLFSKVEIKA